MRTRLIPILISVIILSIFCPIFIELNLIATKLKSLNKHHPPVTSRNIQQTVNYLFHMKFSLILLFIYQILKILLIITPTH